MNTKELSNRLTQIVQGITNTQPIRIKATIEVFLEEFDPSQNYLLSISDIEGYETQFIEFEIWDKNDGPIPGIKLFKDFNIYLEREFANTNPIIPITMETNLEYLIQILRDPSLDTGTLEEQQEINNLDLSQGLHTFLYDAYTGIITYQPNKLKQVSSDIIYQSDHIIILDSDSTICLD